MTTYYSLANGELRLSRDDPTFEWRGHVDSMPVAEIRPLPDDSGALLLLEPPAGTTRVRNLVKVNAEARVIWRGELPDGSSGDCFVSLEVEESGDVSASTWSGYRVILSRETGRLLDRQFTK